MSGRLDPKASLLPTECRVAMPKIFISYRREDSSTVAGIVAKRLASAFGNSSIMLDVDSIPPGQDFRAYIRDELETCDVMVAMIGKGWLTALDDAGRPRLENPQDWVRLELESGLERGSRIPVIPVLLDNVPCPKPEELPDSLRELAYRQAHSVRPPFDFDMDVERLIQKIKSQCGPRLKRMADQIDSGAALENQLNFRNYCHGYARNMLDSSPRLRMTSKWQIELSGQMGPETVRLNDLWARSPRLILAGSPGGGKTVFLLSKFRDLCGQLETTAELNDGAMIVPVYAELGLLNEHKGVSELVLECLGLAPGPNPLEKLQRVLEFGSLALLLDGINELPEHCRKECAKQLISLDDHLRAAGKAHQVQITVTTRPYGFQNYFHDAGFDFARVLPLTRDEIQQQLAERYPSSDEHAALGPKLRHLLSNPQHLAYAIEWLDDGLRAPAGGRRGIHSRGGLLAYCTSKRLARLPAEADDLGKTVLQHIAYGTTDGRVHYSKDQVWRAVDETLRSRASASISPRLLYDELLTAELLVASGDTLRFAHHSIQQYFTAREMTARLELKRYVEDVLWHEPLVIMAGLLDKPQLGVLLPAVRRNDELYAYVLANIDEPDLDRELMLRTVSRFSRRVRHWANGMTLELTGLYALWFFALPVIGFLFHTYGPQLNGPLIVLATFAYVFFVPFALLRWHQRRFKRAVRHLRERDLPRLVASLRYLDASGAMRQLKQDLNAVLTALRSRHVGNLSVGESFYAKSILQEVLPCRLDTERVRITFLASDDPRVAFVNEANRLIEQAINAQSYMTEDEMLDQIADPLSFVSIDADSLDADQVEKLCALASAAENEKRAEAALAKLQEVYSKNPEFRDRLAVLFRTLARDGSIRGRRRHQARMACRRLGIEFQVASLPKRAWLVGWPILILMGTLIAIATALAWIAGAWLYTR
jgi:hypothetical protein